MSYFEKIFKQQVKDALKEMVANGEIFIDGTDIYLCEKEQSKALKTRLKVIKK